jgi:hypothetical protein
MAHTPAFFALQNAVLCSLHASHCTRRNITVHSTVAASSHDCFYICVYPAHFPTFLSAILADWFYGFIQYGDEGRGTEPVSEVTHNK